MTDTVELLARLRDICRDRNGEQIVDESTTRVEIYCGEVREIIAAIQLLEEQNARMREALTFYANGWTSYAVGMVASRALLADEGDKARAALENNQ